MKHTYTIHTDRRPLPCAKAGNLGVPVAWLEVWITSYVPCITLVTSSTADLTMI